MGKYLLPRIFLFATLFTVWALADELEGLQRTLNAARSAKEYIEILTNARQADVDKSDENIFRKNPFVREAAKRTFDRFTEKLKPSFEQAILVAEFAYSSLPPLPVVGKVLPFAKTAENYTQVVDLFDNPQAKETYTTEKREEMKTALRKKMIAEAPSHAQLRIVSGIPPIKESVDRGTDEYTEPVAKKFLELGVRARPLNEMCDRFPKSVPMASGAGFVNKLLENTATAAEFTDTLITLAGSKFNARTDRFVKNLSGKSFEHFAAMEPKPTSGEAIAVIKIAKDKFDFTAEPGSTIIKTAVDQTNQFHELFELAKSLAPRISAIRPPNLKTELVNTLFRKTIERARTNRELRAAREVPAKDPGKDELLDVLELIPAAQRGNVVSDSYRAIIAKKPIPGRIFGIATVEGLEPEAFLALSKYILAKEPKHPTRFEGLLQHASNYYPMSEAKFLAENSDILKAKVPAIDAMLTMVAGLKQKESKTTVVMAVLPGKLHSFTPAAELEKLVNIEADLQPEVYRMILQKATTPVDFATSVDLLLRAKDPKSKTNAKAAVAGTLDTFVATHPSITEINRLLWDPLLKLSTRDQEALILKLLRRAGKLDDFSGLRLPGFPWRSAEFQKELAEFARKNPKAAPWPIGRCGWAVQIVTG